MSQYGDTLELFTPPARLGETFVELRDGTRLVKATQKVFLYMADGRWYTTEQLRQPFVGGLSGDRRARDLRDSRCGSLTVETRNVGRGLWEYRIVATPEQLLRAADLLKVPRSAVIVGAQDVRQGVA